MKCNLMRMKAIGNDFESNARESRKLIVEEDSRTSSTSLWEAKTIAHAKLSSIFRLEYISDLQITRIDCIFLHLETRNHSLVSNPTSSMHR
jgi:hypothetical protein